MLLIARLVSLAAAFCIVAVPPTLAEEPAAPEADLKKLSVDELVERLVSPFPMRYYDVFDRTIYDHPYYQQDRHEVVHPRVLAASDELVARGRDAVPKLLKHRKDERYCWTPIVAAPSNLSVSRRVGEIIETILRPELAVDYDGFKGQPGFDYYLARVGVERYLAWSKRTTERERELDYLRWYVRELNENPRLAPVRKGEEEAFIEEHLTPFRNRIAELETAGVATKSPLDEESAKPAGKE